ncbi:MAG: translation initiation factor IF-3 [Bacteroidota bacterium]
MALTQNSKTPYNRFNPPQKKEEHRINSDIRVPEVRLVGENIEPGVYSTREALRMAEDEGVDLVEISPNAVPPVCRLIDYTKFLYDKKKKEKEIKSNSQKTIIKEIRFTPHTDDHDFDFKVKHAEKFLKDGSKVKCYVQFKGRAIVFQDMGELLLLKFAKSLEDIGLPEQLPKLEGKRMFMIMNPKAPKKK